MVIKLIQEGMTMTGPIARTIASKGAEVTRNCKASKERNGGKTED